MQLAIWINRMRNIPKIDPPALLTQNKDEWDANFLDNPSDTNKYRYRDQNIKARLKEETHTKCIYCESKIGDTTPGDIEHKLPVSRRPELLFAWDNLTIACNECNRRKRDYYDPECAFLDPNADDVESLIIHAGPFVFSIPGNR